MIEKLEPHNRIIVYNPHGITEIPPDKWELMHKINEIIEHINKMEENK